MYFINPQGEFRWTRRGGLLRRAAPRTLPSPTWMGGGVRRERGAGGLAKVVDGQPEHVIGAHPRLVNVLQDEALVESHDGVIVYL